MGGAAVYLPEFVDEIVHVGSDFFRQVPLFGQWQVDVLPEQPPIQDVPHGVVQQLVTSTESATRFRIQTCKQRKIQHQDNSIIVCGVSTIWCNWKQFLSYI